MRTESGEYYAARERAERTAAEKANCPEAQRAHEELARAYAKLAQNAQLHGQQPDAKRPAA
jgi:hypothetical protein